MKLPNEKACVATPRATAGFRAAPETAPAAPPPTVSASSAGSGAARRGDGEHDVCQDEGEDKLAESSMEQLVALPRAERESLVVAAAGRVEACNDEACGHPRDHLRHDVGSAVPGAALAAITDHDRQRNSGIEVTP
eukprot:CAMPEP_0115565790 /NCGR_PEP_ID=MMETSP0271-20121206/103253_1 /TAXON_ID=71861 /ORGANISM="Scrippsiella trochoidea, Strain CCMP3099" /LENGTH=135 /DNA_ID=CAMNT_0003000083 /DNA_START=85 /DNA_END=493 /DNA_ORIENTATION=-